MPKNRFFLSFLSTYLMIILIPISIGIIINNSIVREFEKHIKGSHLTFLKQTQEIVELRTNEIKWSVFQIAGNTKLLRLLSAGRERYNYNDILYKEIVDDFYSYLVYTSSISTTFYVYLKEANLILTPHSKYNYKDFIGGRTFFQGEGIDAEIWHEELFTRYYNGVFLPARTLTVEDFKSQRIIPYIQSLPIGYSKNTGDVKAVVVYLIGENEFKSIMSNINVPPGGWVYIADENNNIITSYSEEQDIVSAVDLPEDTYEGLRVMEMGNEDMYVIYTKSSLNNWKYVAVLPSQWVLKEISYLQILSITALCISLVLSIFLATFIAHRRAAPLQKMVTLIRDFFSMEKPDDISYKSLNSRISTLISNNISLQDQLKKQLSFVQSAFLNRLLHGYFRNQNGLNLFLTYLNVNIEEELFIAMTVNLGGYEHLASIDIIDELNKTKVVLKDSITNTFSGRLFIYDQEENQLAIIIMHKEREISSYLPVLKRELKTFEGAIHSIINTPIFIGIGKAYPDLLKIHHSYEEAKTALSYRSKKNENQIIWFPEISPEFQEYYYPIELEIRLINAAKAGDSEHVKSIFNLLETENYTNRKLTSDKLKSLYFELQSTLVKTRTQLANYLKNSSETQLNEPPEDFNIKIIQNDYLKICEIINHNKKSHNSALIKGITEYLEKNYFDPNLSLCSVASQFSITESYLSFFFKEQTGANFSWQLEKIRIEHAVELLKETKMHIKEIAGEVGYYSDKTFRRVFRRVKGLSPSEFRQDYILNKII